MTGGDPTSTILIADDDAVGRAILTAYLDRLGFEVLTATDGDEAWSVLQSETAPRIAVLDWMMPGLDGVDICRRLRDRTSGPGMYVIMLTSRDRQADLVEALEAGADDYVTKPFQPAELAARIRVGQRVVSLQRKLEDRVRELEENLAKVRELQMLLPICSYCRQIRDDQDYWQSIEQYFARHSDVRFSHGICPNCMEKHWGDEAGDV